ncbi:MAG: dihydrolipoamide acetyltransferase family protein [Armatimonas sp.]
MADIIMPKMGDAMEEGTIVQILKNVGDTVGPDDAVFEIETDKSNVEVPAGAAGVVHEIRHGAGSTVPVGTVVVVLGQGAPPANAGTAPPAPVSSGSAGTGEPEKANTEPTTSGTPVPPQAETHGGGGGNTPTPKVVEFVAGKPLGDTYAGALPENFGGSASVLGEPIDAEAPASAGSDIRVKASPLARAMAAASGVSLASISAAGPIKAADVKAALQSGTSGTPAAAGAGGAVSTPVADEVEVQVYNAMRKTIARRLTESKQTIPHFYVTIEVDMEELLALREKINAGAEAAKAPKVTVNDCLIKAVAVAMRTNPNVNSKFEDNKRIVSKAANIGFGVALEDGLIVPVVRNVESKSLREIAGTTKPLVEKARSGKLQPAEYTGGTFTVSNMGAVAEVENFAAIVNPGEGAILAISSTRTVPAVVGGQIVIRKRMKMTLSADHRVVDGADAAAFLGDLKRVIETPMELLL